MTTVYSSEINHRMLHPKFGFLKIPFQGVAEEPVVDLREKEYVLHVKYKGIIDSDSGLIAEVNCFYHCPAANALLRHGIFNDTLRADTSSAVWTLFTYEVVEDSRDFYTNWTFKSKPCSNIDLLKQLDSELAGRFKDMMKKMKAGEIKHFSADEVLKEFMFEKFSSKENPEVISDDSLKRQFVITAGNRRVSEFKSKIQNLYWI